MYMGYIYMSVYNNKDTYGYLTTAITQMSLSPYRFLYF